MSWSFRIGRIAGTDVKIHFTFLLLLGYVALQANAGGGSSAAIASVVRLLALFACVLLHEFGHIAAGRHYGILTPDVILLPIGGVARLSRIPEEPRQELVIALAGPAVTLAIAVAAWLILKATGTPSPGLTPDIFGAPIVAALFTLNVELLLFNLIPAFPMDGGRVLRALLATRLPYARATRAAARVGQMLAAAAALYSLLGRQQDLWLLLIAAFVYLAAGAEAAAVETRTAARGIDVTNMMVTDFRTLPFHATIADAVAMLLASEQREFPVVDNDGRVEGMLTRDHLIHALSQHGPTWPVHQAMAAGAPAVPAGMPFMEALATLRASGLPALPVVDVAGKLVGMLTMDNVTDLLLVRRALPAG